MRKAATKADIFSDLVKVNCKDYIAFVINSKRRHVIIEPDCGLK